MVETQLPHTSAFRNADFQSAVSQISNLPVTINTMRDKLLWPLPPADFSLAPNEIHVWAASLDVTPAHLADLVLTLAPDEQARAARFHFARDRNRFRAGRGLLRAILSHYLQTEPSKLIFCYNPQGKPALAANFKSSGLAFNLAHSENLALLAVARAAQIGVDVEQIRPIPDADQLVARFFSPCESASFQRLPDEQKPVAFFNLWTRKEAWLKATGEGIAHSLKLVEVSFLPSRPAELFSIKGSSAAASRWQLHELVPSNDFAAALAFERCDKSISCWRWPGDSK